MRLHDRILAFTCAGTALGIVAFWLTWFYALAQGTAGSECYVAFENSFPPSDFILAGLLIYVARGLWRGVVYYKTAAFATGMLGHLFALDFFWNGPAIFTTDINPGAGFIVGLVFTLMLWLGLRTARAPRDDNPAPGIGRRLGILAVLLVYLVFTAGFWINHFDGSHASPELDPCAQVFTSTFLLADIIGCLGALWALIALPWWSRTARFAVLFTSGGMFFGTLNVFTFVALGPDHVGSQYTAYIILCIFFIWLAMLLTALVDGGPKFWRGTSIGTTSTGMSGDDHAASIAHHGIGGSADGGDC